MQGLFGYSNTKMYQTKKFSTTSLVPHRVPGVAEQHFSPVPSMPMGNEGGDIAARVVAASSKQRLRWTTELHERFVEAVTQLGGPESESLNNYNFFLVAKPNKGLRVQTVQG